jgi:hypothetical protein
MQGVTRQEIFAQAARKLRQEFQELSTVPHGGLKGQEAEELVRKFLRGHLPKRFDVGSGFIIDACNNLSKQTDVIIYDALHCPVYRASETAAIIPSDNVAAIVEVKSQLDKQRMEETFANAAAAKGLAKTALPNIPLSFPVTAQTFSCLFAFATSLNLETLAEHYADGVRKYALGRHVDVVLVLDKGIIMLAAQVPEFGPSWNPLMMEGFGGKKGEGSHIAVSTTKMEDDSLDMFLRILLAQLVHFRGLAGHPGFDWRRQGVEVPALLSYLTSITHETDPALRSKKLAEYEEEVRANFAASPMPTKPESTRPKEPPPASEAPDVIVLPPPSD